MSDSGQDENMSDDRYEPDMSVAEFKRRQQAGNPVQVATSREEYQGLRSMGGYRVTANVGTGADGVVLGHHFAAVAHSVALPIGSSDAVLKLQEIPKPSRI